MYHRRRGCGLWGVGKPVFVLLYRSESALRNGNDVENNVFPIW